MIGRWDCAILFILIICSFWIISFLLFILIMSPHSGRIFLCLYFEVSVGVCLLLGCSANGKASKFPKGALRLSPWFSEEKKKSTNFPARCLASHFVPVLIPPSLQGERGISQHRSPQIVSGKEHRGYPKKANTNAVSRMHGEHRAGKNEK